MTKYSDLHFIKHNMFEFDYFKCLYWFYSLMEYKYFIRYVHFAFFQPQRQTQKKMSFSTGEYSANNFKFSGVRTINLAKGTCFYPYGISAESKPRNTPFTPEQLDQTF